ncbi:aminoglycoside phosphotransferase family protein [Frateuria aurantia]
MDNSTDRAQQRLEWARQRCGQHDIKLEPASADASFRSYWRLGTAAPGQLLMDSPPTLENPLPWLEIGRRLHDAGLHVPEVYAADLEQGFLLIEDLGDQLYLGALDEASADALYRDAMQALLQIQTRVDTTGLAVYDQAFLLREMELLPEWYLGRHLGLDPAPWQRALQPVFLQLAAQASEQPQGFVHRDFHSRNLLVSAAHNPAIIDFQGALLGPLTYDLASLLRDCYIRWPDPQVHAWVEEHRRQLVTAGRLAPEVDEPQFLRWFELTGLQRHLKVLGLFCRLAYRDGKQAYLADLPLVFDYVQRAAARYPELEPLTHLPPPGPVMSAREQA